MRLPRADWSRWLLAVGLAVAIVAGGLTLYRAPEPRIESGRTERAPAVTVAPESDPLATEEAMLRDPTPLFLPTRWNASENALPAAARPQPGSAFQDFAPAWKFTESELRLHLPPAVTAPTRLADAITADRAEQPLIGVGRSDREVVPLPVRGAYVRVSSAADGQVVLARSVDAKPPGEPVWQPLEFLVAVDRAGLIRPAVLIESSRVLAVDGFFQEYLSQGFHLGERLPPGFYRVSIGP